MFAVTVVLRILNPQHLAHSVSIWALLRARTHQRNLNPQNIYTVEEHTTTAKFPPLPSTPCGLSRYTLYWVPKNFLLKCLSSEHYVLVSICERL